MNLVQLAMPWMDKSNSCTHIQCRGKKKDAFTLNFFFSIETISDVLVCCVAIQMPCAPYFHLNYLFLQLQLEQDIIAKDQKSLMKTHEEIEAARREVNDQRHEQQARLKQITSETRTYHTQQEKLENVIMHPNWITLIW